KAISLRIRMQTQSPGLTPIFCKPPAIRAARAATSAWSRRRSPLTMPWKREDAEVILFFANPESLADHHHRARPDDPRLACYGCKDVDGRNKSGHDATGRYQSIKFGARFSMFARTASVWFAVPINACCS